MPEPTPVEVVREFLDEVEQSVWKESWTALNDARAATVDIEEQVASLEAELAEAREAIRVYTSDLHRCSTRPCSCGAYSSLTAFLSRHSPAEEPSADE